MKIRVQDIPGWVNAEALHAHLRFIEGYPARIRRLAMVSDRRLLSEIRKLVPHGLTQQGPIRIEGRSALAPDASF